MALSSLNHPIESDVPSQVLIDFPEINLTLDQVKKFLNGQSLKVSETNRALYRVYNFERKFIGIGKIYKNKLLAPQRIFHLT